MPWSAREAQLTQAMGLFESGFFFMDQQTTAFGLPGCTRAATAMATTTAEVSSAPIVRVRMCTWTVLYAKRGIRD